MKSFIFVEESWKRGSTFRYCREYILGAVKTLELKKGDTIFQQDNDPQYTSKLASNCVTINSSCSHWTAQIWIPWNMYGFTSRLIFNSAPLYLPVRHCFGMQYVMNRWKLVLGSPVQSGLLSNFDKTETWTGPHKSTNLKKLDWTNINWFSAVFVGFLRLKDQSQPVCTGVWEVGSTLTVVPTVNKIYMKTNYITLWAPARKAPPLTE